MEQVLEQIVGAVQDEFDTEEPELVKESDGSFLVSGKTNIDFLNDQLDINLHSESSDTLSGLIVEKVGPKLKTGVKIELDPKVSAEILKVKGMRAIQVRLLLPMSQDKSKSNI